ncbi:glycosyltransferase family 2 protein [Deinococcus enclensis]|uniref:Rhamnosyltransferase n=1 Tax=Deinococcus enclensis TaxID=1049582 RepID=A0ABT9MBN3_9DEIO|nr:glycosyltransferase family 2 protein [Deinococcus enclensis]MDP9764002.1 rhamnosyltransferase [Deinococcus enclensis]
MIKIGAVIVTYNPGKEIEINLKAISKQCDEVLVIDNGSTFRLEELIDPIPSNVTIINLSSNTGIAHAFNIGVTLLSDDIDWVATFDQDTYILDNYFNNMIEQGKKINVETPHILVPSFNGLPQNEQYKSMGIREVVTAISSGSLIRRDVFSLVGGFDDQLFIDYVDNEFYLRCQNNGVRLFEIIGIKLNHKLGDMEPHVLLGRRFHTSNHSPLRRYYVFRNRIFVYRKFAKHFPIWFLRDFLRNFTEILKILIWENNKTQKLYYISKGLLDGMKNKTGEYDRRG